MAQNYTYKPTKAEQALLSVLSNPEHRRRNVVEICEIAGISRKQYYNIFRKPQFVEYYLQLTRDIIKHSVMPIVHAARREALKGSYYHQKMLLEMAGEYQDKRITQHTGPGGGPVQIEHFLESLDDDA